MPDTLPERRTSASDILSRLAGVPLPSSQTDFSPLKKLVRGAYKSAARETAPTSNGRLSRVLGYACKSLSQPTSQIENSPLARLACDAYNKASKMEGLLEQAPCMKRSSLHASELLLGIGVRDFSPKSSATNKAYAFSESAFAPPEEDRGSERGAFRHILWQSDITAKYGENVARHVGNCHEREQNFYPNERLFASVDDADRTVDQLNNIIGRRVGNEFKYLSTKERALKILRIGLNEGFYRVQKRNDGFFEIVKKPMSYDEYRRKYQQIIHLDVNGESKE